MTGNGGVGFGSWRGFRFPLRGDCFFAIAYRNDSFFVLAVGVVFGFRCAEIAAARWRG
jgi:hypothetical protein